MGAVPELVGNGDGLGGLACRWIEVMSRFSQWRRTMSHVAFKASTRASTPFTSVR